MFAILFLSCTFPVCLTMEGIAATIAGGGMPHIGSPNTCVDGPSSLDGNIASSRFSYPWGLVFDDEKNSIFVADCGCPDTPHSNDRIRRIDLTKRYVSTAAGSEQGFLDGKGIEAKFFHPAGMTLDHKRQMLYAADSGNNAIRAINLDTNDVTTLAGHGDQEECNFKDGVGEEARFCNPQQVHMNSDNSQMFVADTDNHAIRAIDMDSLRVTTITGGKDKEGFEDGNLATAQWRHPTGLSYDENNEMLYVADHYNHAIRSIDFRTGDIKTLVGQSDKSRLAYPEGLVLDAELGILYIAEFERNRISFLNLHKNELSVLAGGRSFGTRDAVGEDAQFYHPTCISFNNKDKVLYVTDQYNHRIRSVTALGNTQKAHPNKLLLEHFKKVDAYRDLLVHKKLSVFALFYIFVAVLLMTALCRYRRKWLTFLKSHIVAERIANKKF